MAPAGGALPAMDLTSSVDLFPWAQKPSYREENPASRWTRGGQPHIPSPGRARSYAMSGIFPFSPCVLANLRRLGPTNSGPVHVAQKPFSSSASRVLTWINATSIGICNARVSTRPHGRASRTCAHPPTAFSGLLSCDTGESARVSEVLCATFIFEARLFGRGVVTHSLTDAYC